jgi:hypothetical protein
MSHSLLYIKFVVTFIMLLLIVMQLFDDVLLFVPMITNLISL